MNMNTNVMFAHFGQRDENGEIDLDLTTFKFRAELEVYKHSQKADCDTVKTTILSVFEQFPVNIPVPYLVSLVAAKLSTPPTGFAILGERVHEVIRSNPNLFKVAKGKGGGCSLIKAEETK